MIFAALLALPLWQVMPAYFLIGAIWAVVYLPRSITLQARAYKAWRDGRTNGRPLAEVLGAESITRKGVIQPQDYLNWCEQQPFRERRILTGFIANVAFWPLRIVEKLLFDILRSTFVWFFERLADMWNLVIVPMFRTLFRVLRAIGRGIRAVFRWVERGIRAFFRWLGHALEAIWDHLIMPVCRAIHRGARTLWHDVLVPMYTWMYRYVVKVYQTIIQRANREAIADLAALNNATQKDPVK